MQRRKFLAGVGSLAAGSAAAMGTGAFTSVSADRTVSVSVADDSDALLALQADKGENSAYTSQLDNGEVAIDISDSGVYSDANGVNADARTIIHETFQVKNNGTQAVFVYVDPDDTVGDPPQSPSNESENLQFEDGLYIDPQGSEMPNNSGISLTNVGGYNDFPNAPNPERWVVDAGKSFYFGLWIDAEADATGGSYEMNIKADADLVPDDYE